MGNKAVDACKNAGGRSKDGFLWMITREKFIQGGITTMLFGIVSALTEGFGIVLVNAFMLDIPAKWIMVPILVLFLILFVWADSNIEEWQSLIEETTGEDIDNDGQTG